MNQTAVEMSESDAHQTQMACLQQLTEELKRKNHEIDHLRSVVADHENHIISLGGKVEQVVIPPLVSKKARVSKKPTPPAAPPGAIAALAESNIILKTTTINLKTARKWMAG